MRTLKLMADYYSHPIWRASHGEVGNIDPETLPISDMLKQQLRKWADEYDETLDLSDPASAGFSDLSAKQKFQEEGMRLAQQLQRELDGQYIVSYVGH